MKFKELIIMIDAINQIITNLEYFQEFKINDIRGYFQLLEITFNIKIDYQKSIDENKIGDLIKDLKILKANKLAEYQKEHNLE